MCSLMYPTPISTSIGSRLRAGSGPGPLTDQPMGDEAPLRGCEESERQRIYIEPNDVREMAPILICSKNQSFDTGSSAFR